MTLTNFFFDSEGVLRSGWRAAGFVALFLTIFAASGIAMHSLLAGSRIDGGQGSIMMLLANALVALIAALIAGWFAGKFFESLPFRTLGGWFTRGFLKNLMLGNLLGMLTLLLAVAVPILVGGLDFQRNPSHARYAVLITMGVSALVFVVAAAAEEALFRGYLLQTFIRADLAWFGIVLTSLLFAAVHNANPGATFLSWINTFIAGIWFAIAYMKTRDLWFVTGLHFAWNWMQGAFFGVEVSGLRELISAPYLQEIDSGPAWLTGGDYGLEGGLATTAAIIVSIIAIHYFPHFLLRPDPKLLELISPRMPEAVSSVRSEPRPLDPETTADKIQGSVTEET